MLPALYEHDCVNEWMNECMYENVEDEDAKRKLCKLASLARASFKLQAIAGDQDSPAHYMKNKVKMTKF